MPEAPTQRNTGRWRLWRAAEAMRAGEIVAYPTEGVYGLGCDPWQPAAVACLLALKRRPPAKGLIVLAADVEQLRGLVAEAALEDTQVRATWPGPVTWVLPARRGVPAWLTGGRAGLAVRVTGHPLAAALAAEFGGAIVSTSANLAGRAPACTALAVRLRFATRVRVVIAGATGGRGTPTEIRAYPGGRILRPA